MTKFKLKLQYATEHQIQSQILDYLHLRNIFAWRNNTGGFANFSKGKKYFVRYGLKGSGDIFSVYKGKFISIEVKSWKGIVSDEQKDFMEKINSNGGIAFIARNIDDVIKVYRNL
jgi:hypothetical protein